MNNVKPKRSYRSSRRKKQAESTRSAVLDAAGKLFRENGWGGTTIAAIANRADVSPETIYSRFGNKKAIVHELVFDAMRGGQPKAPFLEQEQRAGILKATDGLKIINAFSNDIAGLLTRVAPIMAVVRSAAETDPEMADLYVDLHRTRRQNLGKLITALEANGALRPAFDPEIALDTLWSVVSPELWLLRVDQLGATPNTNREWIKLMLQRLLLDMDT